MIAQYNYPFPLPQTKKWTKSKTTPPRIRPARLLHPNTLNAPTSCRDVHRALVESETTEIWKVGLGGMGSFGMRRTGAVYFLTAVTSREQ